MLVTTSGTTNKIIKTKPVQHISDPFYFKQKSSVRQLDASNMKLKVIRKGTYFWYTIQKCRGFIKINKIVNQALNNSILKNTHAMQSPI